MQFYEILQKYSYLKSFPRSNQATEFFTRADLVLMAIVLSQKLLVMDL